jgi:hypothetical protein
MAKKLKKKITENFEVFGYRLRARAWFGPLYGQN